MRFEEIIAISGLPGLYRMIANRPNGLIVEDFDNKKRKFIPVRNHQFSPLGSIAIYTDSDAVELKKVFQSMFDHKEAFQPLGPNASAEELRAYFENILPDYDRDRVHVNDMKKVLRWYTFLSERNLFPLEQTEAGDATE